MTATSLAEQIDRQRRWVLKIDQFRSQVQTLVELEFESADLKADRRRTSLTRYLNFIFAEVPYYRALKKQLGTMSVQDIVDKPEIFPELTKTELRDHASDLEASRLPAGHRVVGVKQSSGTTGKPTRVLQTNWGGNLFALNKQRECRWFDMNPMGTLGIIRLPSQLARIGGEELGLRENLRLPGWPNLRYAFETGHLVAFSVLNDLSDQLRWLKDQNPDYLLAYAETLEHLAFGLEGTTFEGNLKSIQSISETMTADMHTRITDVFVVPIHQNYGLNELGLVASRCPEGGRYHIHDETFMVELIGPDGQPCKVGETGRIIVTSLRNLGMPLFRYDTDDVAIATDQDCPCGRTLPCFGDVVGRYSRIAYLPEGTLAEVGVLRDAMAQCDDAVIRPLRRYQIRQLEDRSYQLLVLAQGELTRDFDRSILNHWTSHTETPPRLSILRVEALQPGPSGKFQDFVSHYMP
jgi:phenylacetate-CoA ligase